MNVGNRNRGHNNTGDWNTGNRNTGDRNTGYRNTGGWNICNGETGFFNTTQPETIRVFNRDCDVDTWFKAIKPEFLFFNLTEWVDSENMTDEEKVENPSYETTGGYLKEYGYKEAFKRSKEYGYKEAFKRSYESLDQEDRKLQVEQLKALPNFDKDVFYEISGIDIDAKQSKKIIIDGKEIEISEDSFNSLKKQLLEG